jgi:uncharacterized membrane protein YhiD involved in acid resistance
VILAMLLCAVLAQLLGWVYKWTHRGLSYSQAFIHSLVIIAVIVCVVMLVIGENIVTAFGLLGALAIIRFRNVLKDTRDTTFIFMSLVIGMATGTGQFPLAILVTLFVGMLCLYLVFIEFGARERHDAMLRLQLAGPSGDDTVQAILRRYCRKSYLASERATAAGRDLAYQLYLRDPSRGGDLVVELGSIPEISGVSYVRREEELEV